MAREVIIGNRVDGFCYVEKEVVGLVQLLDELDIGIPAGELHITFLWHDEMCAVHKRFLNDSSLTDVITFPGDASMNFAGEICISVECAQENVFVNSVTFDEEVSLYIVHGCLHLAGLNDISEKEIIKMRKGEKFCMEQLKMRNLLPKFSFMPVHTC